MGLVKNKLKKLGFPFLILTSIALIPKILLEPILKNGASFSLKYLATVLLYPRKYVWGHLWFIPVYLTIMPFTYLAYRRFRNKKFVWSFFIIFASVLGCYPLEINLMGIKDICRFTIYALIGMTVEPVVSKNIENIQKKITYFLLAIIGVTVALVFVEIVVTRFTKLDIKLVFIIKLIVGLIIPVLISEFIHSYSKTMKMCEYLGL